MKLAKHQSLIKLIENAVVSPTHIFKNLYFRDEGGELVDILDDGSWSCAIFVSWILLPLGLVKDAHATVSATEKDLIESGWLEISDLKPGAILIWEDTIGKEDGKMHGHLGFYLSGEDAVSNNSKGLGDGLRVPHKHHYTYNDTRKIKKIYWHKDLDD